MQPINRSLYSFSKRTVILSTTITALAFFIITTAVLINQQKIGNVPSFHPNKDLNSVILYGISVGVALSGTAIFAFIAKGIITHFLNRAIEPKEQQKTKECPAATESMHVAANRKDHLKKPVLSLKQMVAIRKDWVARKHKNFLKGPAREIVYRATDFPYSQYCVHYNLKTDLKEILGQIDRLQKQLEKNTTSEYVLNLSNFLFDPFVHDYFFNIEEISPGAINETYWAQFLLELERIPLKTIDPNDRTLALTMCKNHTGGTLGPNHRKRILHLFTLIKKTNNEEDLAFFISQLAGVTDTTVASEARCGDGIATVLHCLEQKFVMHAADDNLPAKLSIVFFLVRDNFFDFLQDNFG